MVTERRRRYTNPSGANGRCTNYTAAIFICNSFCVKQAFTMSMTNLSRHISSVWIPQERHSEAEHGTPWLQRQKNAHIFPYGHLTFFTAKNSISKSTFTSAKQWSNTFSFPRLWTLCESVLVTNESCDRSLLLIRQSDVCWNSAPTQVSIEIAKNENYDFGNAIFGCSYSNFVLF